MWKGREKKGSKEKGEENGVGRGQRQGFYLKYLFNLNTILNLHEPHNDNKLLYNKTNIFNCQYIYLNVEYMQNTFLNNEEFYVIFINRCITILLCDNGSPSFFSTSLSSSTGNIWESDGVKALNWILMTEPRNNLLLSFYYFRKSGKNLKKKYAGKIIFSFAYESTLKKDKNSNNCIQCI